MSDINAKIQKLLSLAENNTNEAEAKAAFAKAHNLISEHGYQEPKESYVVSHDYSYKGGTRKCNWKLNLGLAAGYASGCNPILHENSVCWVGDEGDLKTARIMFDYLINTLANLTKKLKGRGRGYIAAYRLGFSREVLDAAREKYNESRQESIFVDGPEPKEGLVVLDNQINKYCSDVMGWQIKHVHRNVTYSCSDGYGSGKNAGYNTSTSRQVTNGLYLGGR